MANYSFFFSESQVREVLPESPVNDIYFTVGSHVSAQWKDNKWYDTNILYIGSEANCDAKIQYVTTTGQLKNRFFFASGAPITKKHRSSSCTRNIPHNMAPVEPPITDLAVSQIIQLNNISEGFMKIHRRLDEIMIRQRNIETCVLEVRT